jgi:AcrR family transcriptional regulator
MKTRMKGDERRAAIVDTAIHLFAEKGFRGATTRELAAAAGVTEPILYRHFRTKRDLYTAIIEAKAGEANVHAADLAQLADRGDDREFLCAVGELVLKRYENDPEISRLLLFSCLERHELADLFLDRLFLGLYKLVAGYIRRRVRSGEFRKVDPEIATRGFVGMIAYHGLFGLLFPNRFGTPNRRRVVNQMVTVFLSGMQG